MFLIQIDMDDCIDLGIDPGAYALLYLMHSKKYSKIIECWNFEDVKTMLLILEEKGLLRTAGSIENDTIEFQKVIIKYKFLSKATNINDYDLFKELFESYPSVAAGRRLKTNREKSKQKYESIVKDDVVLHKKILMCLKREVEERTMSGSMKYMQALPTWINNRSWEVYEDSITDTSDNKVYGTTIL